MIRVRVNREGFARVRTEAQALAITHADFAGEVLTKLGVVHRKQEKRIFATEGSAGAAGRWLRLSPAYAKQKRKTHPHRRILVRTGDMRARLTVPSNANYYQDYVVRSGSRGVFRFGARSKLAATHRAGLGTLPIREMLDKTAAQIAEMQAALRDWYIKRVKRVIGARGLR